MNYLDIDRFFAYRTLVERERLVLTNLSIIHFSIRCHDGFSDA